MKRFFLVIMAVIFSTQALAEATIDAASQETYNASLQSMKQELSSTKIAELDQALMLLPFAGIESAKDLPADGHVELDIKKLDGLNADQIIELARQTVTVKILTEPPPE